MVSTCRTPHRAVYLMPPRCWEMMPHTEIFVSTFGLSVILCCSSPVSAIGGTHISTPAATPGLQIFTSTLRRAFPLFHVTTHHHRRFQSLFLLRTRCWRGFDSTPRYFSACSCCCGLSRKAIESRGDTVYRLL